jgi:large subunit ribosomal protein L18
MASTSRKQHRRILHKRLRKKLRGTTERPRLAIHFSNKRVYTQVIDDDKGHTLVSASTLEESLTAVHANAAVAAKIGEAIAERAIKAGIKHVVFDRGGFKYHGKVKALADAARAKGLEF